LRERSSGVFLELCRIKGVGEGDIILNYINYMMSWKTQTEMGG
jgi:hypothetical protein